MTGVRMAVTFDDLNVQRMFRRLRNVNMSPMFREIGAYFDSETARRFREGIGPDGSPLEPSQRALETGGKTLVDRGHLRDSYTSRLLGTGDGVEHGSNMVYAAIHHFGGDAGRNRSVEIPARPVIGINSDDQMEVLDIVYDFYVAKMGNRVF